MKTETATDGGQKIASEVPTDGRPPLGFRGGALALGAAAIAIAMVATGVMLLRARQPAQATVTAGDNVAVNQDADSINAHNSPTIAQSPNDPDRLVVVDRIDRPRFLAAVHVSDDGGETWRDVDFPIPQGEDRPYAPDVVWAPDGTVHMVFVTLTGAGNSPEAIWATSSEDSGSTWSTPQRIHGPDAFQIRLAVDAGDGDLYLTWLQASGDALGTNSFTQTGLPIMVARSTDGGETWTEPIQVSSDDRERVGAATPVVGADGGLYVLYKDFGDDVRDWQDLEGPVHDGTFELVLARGDGDDLEFEETVVAAMEPFQRFLVYQPAFASLAVDPDEGTLYAVWAGDRNGDPDVFLSRSTDRGRTWSQPRQVNTDDSGNWQYLPAVSVATNGRVDVVYYDRRDDPDNVLTGVFYAASGDRGESWSTVALSDVLFSSAIGPPAHRGEGAELGSRLDILSNESRALAVWSDTRRGREATAKQDIFFAPVRIVAE